jgi:hypothetical protein
LATPSRPIPPEQHQFKACFFCSVSEKSKGYARAVQRADFDACLDSMEKKERLWSQTTELKRTKA